MDSVVFKNTKSVGTGVIVRDHAMDVAISFAKDIGLQEVTFESDCSVLIGALSDTSKVPISIENIVTGNVTSYSTSGNTKCCMSRDKETHQLTTWYAMTKDS